MNTPDNAQTIALYQEIISDIDRTVAKLVKEMTAYRAVGSTITTAVKIKDQLIPTRKLYEGLLNDELKKAGMLPTEVRMCSDD